MMGHNEMIAETLLRCTQILKLHEEQIGELLEICKNQQKEITLLKQALIIVEKNNGRERNGNIEPRSTDTGTSEKKSIKGFD